MFIKFLTKKQLKVVWQDLRKQKGFKGNIIKLQTKSNLWKIMTSYQQGLQKDHDILEKVDFVKQSWRFIPKHLISIRSQQKKNGPGGMQRKHLGKDTTYQQTTLQIINKNKNLYLTPVRDIERIMKHFKRKFQEPINSRDWLEEPKKKKNRTNETSKRIKTTVDVWPQKNQELIQNKITKLLQLPTIKRANSEAQKLKMISMQNQNKKSFEKQEILRKFQLYFSKQIDLINTKNTQRINPQKDDYTLKKLRVKTSID